MPERPLQAHAERHVDPAEVRAHGDQAVGPADDPGDRHPMPMIGGDVPAAEVGDESLEVRDDVVDRELDPRAVDPDLFERGAAEPDDRGGDRVDERSRGSARRRRRD